MRIREEEEGKEQEVLVERLPDDLLCLVLSFVPSPEVVQARLVCRRWRSVLSSQDFAVRWACRGHEEGASMWLLQFDSSRNTGPISALHLSARLSIQLALPPSYSVMASSPAGLLICSPSASLSIVHPLARISEPLPKPPHPPLHVGLSRSHVIIHAVSSSARHHTYHLLDRSRPATWTPVPPPPPPSHPHPPSYHSPRSVPRFVWWGRHEAFCMISACDRVMVYKPGAATWEAVGLPPLPRVWDTRFVTLHVMQGRLFLEGNFQEQGDFQKRYPLQVGVLELVDPATSAWKEVAFMPKDLSRELCTEAHPAHSFYTALSDPLCPYLCFAPFPTPPRQEENLMLLNVNTSTWTSLSLPPNDAPATTGTTTTTTSPSLSRSPHFQGFTLPKLVHPSSMWT